MTTLILKRQVSLLQYLSVVLVILGIAVSMYHPNTNSYGAGASLSTGSLVFGLALSSASRLASSLNTILAER